MTRLAILGSVCLVSLGCATLPACGQQDETQRILAQCGNPAPNQIDSCIEQARVQQEADPSPELKTLIASLIKREADARNKPQSLQPSMPSGESDVGNAYDAPPTPPPSSDLDGGTAYDPPADMPPPEQNNPAGADQGDDDTGQPPPPPPQDNEQNPRLTTAGQDGKMTFEQSWRKQ